MKLKGRSDASILVLVLGTAVLTSCSPARGADLEVGRGVLVSTTVDGRGPFHFCIDTGLNEKVVVSENLAQRLNLPSNGKADLADPSGNHKISVPSVRLTQIAIDAITLRDLTAAVQPSDIGPQECDGVVGLPFFRGYLVTLDLIARKLIVQRGHLGSGEVNVMQLRELDGLPAVTLSIASESIPAHLDTMAPGFSVPLAISAKLNFASPPQTIGLGKTVGGSFEMKGGVVPDVITLGSFHFDGSFIEVNSHFTNVTLGLAALRHFSITFDQQAGLVKFASPELHIQIPSPRMMRVSSPGGPSPP